MRTATGRSRKRDFRRLWIARINAAARLNGVTYSRFMAGLAKSGVAIDRKILADLAITDPAGFTKLVETAKPHHKINKRSRIHDRGIMHHESSYTVRFRPRVFGAFFC